MVYKQIIKEEGTKLFIKYLRKDVVQIKSPKEVIKRLRCGEPLDEMETKRVKCGTVVAFKVDGKIVSGWSVCSDLDQFHGDKGKAIAILRAKSGKCHIDNAPLELQSQIVESRTAMEELAQKYA